MMSFFLARHWERWKDFGKRQLKSRISKSNQVLIKNAIWNIRKKFLKYSPPSSLCPYNFCPKFSIVVPVFNGYDYIRECIDSLLDQSYANIEIIIVDDFSTDRRVIPLLLEYASHSKVKLIRHAQNLGISSAINSGIYAASGDYIGFVDGDDCLLRESVTRVVEHIKENFGKQYFFSNRINKTNEGDEKISFAHKSHSDYRRELLKGMFADHFKVFDRRIFIEIGLLRSEWDFAQDYEFALRTAFFLPNSFHYVNEFLYVHRVYPQQVSSRKRVDQDLFAGRLKEKYENLGFAALSGQKLLSIVILSFNKIEHTVRCIDAIKRSTEGRYEIILFDNGSSAETKDRLVELYSKDCLVKLFLSEMNLGCPRGRKEAISLSTGDYVLTIDNDIVVQEGWSTRLIERIEQSETIGAASCKVVFPDGLVQFTGGFSRTEDDLFIRFGLYDEGERFDSLSTMVERDCDWLPGGATMYRRKVFESAEISAEFLNNYEDNDFSLQLRRNGWRLVSCPAARVLHNHVYFDSASRRDSRYMAERYRTEGIARSALAFYRRNGLIIKDFFALGALGIAGRTDREVVDFFRSAVHPGGNP